MSGKVQNYLTKSLNFIERVGNKLPDPATLFAIMIALVMGLSAIVAITSCSVLHPISKEQITTYNLFNGDIIQRLLIEMPKTFADFPPLGTVLLVMLGIGVADKSGFIVAALKQFMRKVPKSLLSAAVVFAGIMSSLAADAGYVALIPLGAVLFYAADRHPLAGIAATFAGISAGYTANLLLTSLDPLLAGITETAAQIIDPDYTVLITANYYLMIAMVPVLTISGAWVTDKLIEPRLQQYPITTDDDYNDESLSTVEKRGLINAAVVGLICSLVIAWMAVPQDGILRDIDGSLNPFYHSMVAIMFIVFFLCGLAYGITVKSIRSDRDVVNMSAETMSDIGHYIVLAFLAAHLIALFKWSNLGLMIAISGAGLLRDGGLSGPVLLVLFVLISSLINLFIGNASAKWALIAPVFVPMLMLLDYSPEMTQTAYRIGDSATNILTPLMPYFPLVIVFARKYLPDMRIGTLIAMMVPYSVAFGVLGVVMLLLWVAFGIPLGPSL